jgi:uncharacterized protein YjbI with pentapeptide repeats
MVGLLFVGISPMINAESVPDWVKNTAGWWADDAISEIEFVNAIEFLVNEGIIQISASNISEKSENVPDWVKNTAGWWADDAISEIEFVNAIEFLVNEGIIQTEIKVNDSISKSEILCDKREINPNLNLYEKKILCSEIDIGYIYSNPNFNSGKVIHNQLGFRGNEFSIEKPQDTYRIISVGGSTTEGISPNDSETYPAFLQEIFHKNGFQEIEIINAGISGASSLEEKNLIENKLINYSPDMIIIYDGWNDLRTYLGEPEGVNVSRDPDPTKSNPELWKNRWMQFCDTTRNDFQTIIILQPMLGLSDRLLTNFEYSILMKYIHMIVEDADKYDNYAKQLSELSDTCTNAFDFRRIFDKSTENIFRDTGHVSVEGEKILAQNVFNAILPHVKPTLNSYQYEPVFVNKQEKFQTSSEYDFRGMMINKILFTEGDLQNNVYWFAEISFVDYINNKMNGTDFTYSTLSNVVFKDNDAKENKFGRSYISKTTFVNNELDKSNFSGSRISDSIFKENSLQYSKFEGTTIENTRFEEVDFSNSIFNRSDFHNIEFNKSVVSDLKVIHNHFLQVNFTNFDFSKITSSDNSFASCDFRQTNLNEIDSWNHDFSAKTFGGTFYSGSNLSELDLSGVDFTKTTLSFDHGTDYIPARELKKDLAVKITNSDLSNTNLSNKNLVFIDFSESDLHNADLSFSDMRHSNLEGANLEGANLEGANLEGANLEGANLEGANLNCINHKICN